MSHESRLTALKQRFSELSAEVDELKQLKKVAFLPAPPMPQGPPPMDPSMMQGGAPPMDPSMMQGGAPPMDPSMMQGGMPPGMDPSMMQGGAPPVDPNTGMPMDPAMMQGGMPPGGDPAAQGAPPIDPALIDQIVGLLEEMGQKIQQQGQAMEELQNAITGELQDLGDQVATLEKRLVETEAAGAAAQPAAGAGAW